MPANLMNLVVAVYVIDATCLPGGVSALYAAPLRFTVAVTLASSSTKPS